MTDNQNQSNNQQPNVKEVLLATFCSNYSALINTIQVLPIDPFFKALIVFSFSSAFTYAKEHICAMPDTKPVMPNSVAEGEPTPDSKTH